MRLLAIRPWLLVFATSAVGIFACEREEVNDVQQRINEEANEAQRGLDRAADDAGRAAEELGDELAPGDESDEAR